MNIEDRLSINDSQVNFITLNRRNTNEKIKELEEEYKNTKSYKMLWIILFIIVNILSMIAVLFIPLQWIITGDLLFAIVETLGISKELEKEEKKQALSEEIGNLKSQLMWEPNDEIAEYCAKRTIEYKLGNQYYTLPQLEKEETRVIENNEKENVIDKKIGIGKEQIKTYDLKVIKNR